MLAFYFDYPDLLSNDICPFQSDPCKGRAQISSSQLLPIANNENIINMARDRLFGVHRILPHDPICLKLGSYLEDRQHSLCSNCEVTFILHKETKRLKQGRFGKAEFSVETHTHTSITIFISLFRYINIQVIHNIQMIHIDIFLYLVSLFYQYFIMLLCQ